MQVKLLRVLQQRTVVPIGSHQELPVDVRVIAATNRDLESEVKKGQFREDLYYRLNVIFLQTVPLAERTEDVDVLAAASSISWQASTQRRTNGFPPRPWPAWKRTTGRET